MTRQLQLSGDMVASETLTGAVERILHHNEETGWFALLFDAEGQGRIRAVGTFSGLLPGENFRLAGRWIEHPKYGKQFQVASFDPVQPEGLKGIERYLASFIDGISSKLAKKLVRHFGKDTLEVFAHAPHRLSEVPGLGRKRRKKALASWRKTHKVREAMVFLQGLGVSSALALKIYQLFGDNTIDLVRSNPYRLTEVRGIGFHRADAIARSQGLSQDAAERAAAGLVHVLEEASSGEGHMLLPREELLRRTGRLLGLGRDVVEPAIDALCKRRRLCLVGDAVFLRRLENAERIVAERLRALTTEKAASLRLNVDVAINKFENREGIALAAAQQETLREMVASKVMVLTGGPGTGKTTLTKGIVYVATLTGLSVSLAAPTGRAAKRLSEATGVEAKTIHRLLGYQGDAFTQNEDNPLETDLLVIDEASMLDTPLARHLLIALPDSTRLIFVGDVDQLPSVGPGRVLGDLIESGEIPVVRLTEIFRQAEESLIVVNAHRVIRGELPVPGRRSEEDFFLANRPDAEEALAEVTDLVLTRIPKRFGFEPLRDIQVLAPMRRGVLGVENLNQQLQELLNPQGEAPKWAGRRIRGGDRVMQRSNDYELEVFNGEIGVVAGFDAEERKVMIDFDGRLVSYPAASLDELELAYATTIHKSQGSEFPCVVIVLHQQHFVMLQRNLLYTAITRGKQLVIVVGARQAVATATRTETTQRRETRLVERLQGRFGSEGA